MEKLKTGDKLRVIKPWSRVNLGDIVEFESYHNYCLINIRLPNGNIASCWSLDRFELVEDIKLKIIKTKPKNFMVIQRDCKNFVCDCENFEQSKLIKPKEGIVYDIYQKVAEHTTENKSKIKKVK